MFSRVLKKGILGLVFVLSLALLAAPKELSFSQSSESVEAYDFIEVTVNVTTPDAHNPFIDAVLRGSFRKAGAKEQIDVEGFCDSADGSVFRIRFMPATHGEYAIPLRTGRATLSGLSRGSFKRGTATGAARFALIANTPGISSGKEQASTTSLTARQPSG